MSDKMKTAQKLSDDELEGVSGGYIFYAGNVDGSDSRRPWEVIDGRGNVVARYSDRDVALRDDFYNNRYCGEISWDELNMLRNGRW